MKRVLIAAFAAALLLTEPAGAALQMKADARPRHFNWARMAQADVPIPDARIKLRSGFMASYLPEQRIMFLPQPGHDGWDYRQERALFLHELGHVFDYRHLSNTERVAWMQATGVHSEWWDHKNIWTRWDGWATPLAPGEMFAEQYAACALGITRREMNNGGYVTYGWEPPEGTDAALCELIRSFH